ncbi:MAG: ATP-binding cassette domain-containing protein [Coriobacteriales bacterium]|jgi:NitT/TauT family transport system ATP-binding protein|nr:ATP-binding cassette domain-containing protein [Coriobacteriales bacterium]
MMALEICSLSKSFGGRPVLADFSCAVPVGRCICLFGPSGCGKTTLLRILMSLEEPDSGVIRWPQRARISAVFQEDRLCPDLSALANCMLVAGSASVRAVEKGGAVDEAVAVGEDGRADSSRPAWLRRSRADRRSEAHRLICDALAQVGLKGCEHQPVRELSGGQSRRVALVRALVSSYDLLILDEPFKGLDAQARQTVIHYTRQQAQGKTVLLVTHDLSEAEAMGAEVISLTGRGNLAHCNGSVSRG